MEIDYHSIARQNMAGFRDLIFDFLFQCESGELTNEYLKQFKNDFLTHMGIFEWALNDLENKRKVLE